MTQTDKEKYLERRTSSLSAKKADIFRCSCVKYSDAIDVFGCALHDREEVVLTDADLAKLDELRKTNLNIWRHVRIIGQANLLLQEEVIELNARAAAVAKEARLEALKELDEHAFLYSGVDRCGKCSCGWSSVFPSTTFSTTWSDYLEHIAKLAQS